MTNTNTTNAHQAQKIISESYLKATCAIVQNERKVKAYVNQVEHAKEHEELFGKVIVDASILEDFEQAGKSIRDDFYNIIEGQKEVLKLALIQPAKGMKHRPMYEYWLGYIQRFEKDEKLFLRGAKKAFKRLQA